MFTPEYSNTKKKRINADIITQLKSTSEILLSKNKQLSHPNSNNRSFQKILTDSLIKKTRIISDETGK